MMMKSGLEKIILKFHGGLQRYLLTCQANSALLADYFALGSSNSEGFVEFENNFNGTIFHHHFCVKTGVKRPEEFLYHSLAVETYSEQRNISGGRPTKVGPH